MFVLDCSTPCQFLGSNENVPLKIDYKENSVDNSTVSKQKPEEDKTETTAATYCSECHLEMSQTRTKLAIDGWKGTKKSADDGSRQIGDQELPVIVYLCQKCGKIDFRAEEKLKI